METMDILTITPDTWMENEHESSTYLNNFTNWNSIPLLNANHVHDLSDKRLVRFQGMVQDMLNPEYYFEKYEILDGTTQTRSIRNGKYTDFVQCNGNEAIDYESKNNVTKERQTMVMISVPALNDWVHDIEKGKFKVSPTFPTESANNINKRILELDDSPFVQEENNFQLPPNQNKRLCTVPTHTTSSSSTTLQKHAQNFPLPERIGKMCHVNFFENYDKVKLNDILEVVGFLSLEEAESNEDAMEVENHSLPGSLVHRIHCVKWRPLHHNNPLISEDISMDMAKMQNLKQELYTVLTQLFMGDALAAEYFIYYLISKIYLRQELVPIGKFTLNISNIPVANVPNYGKQFYDFIELLVPKSCYMPMTLENMNKITVTPKKDYEQDKIKSGLLQLSNHTCLVLDETKLSPGQLNESGIRAVAAFSNTIKNQKVVYDFCYYQMEFDCDIPILILSEGKSFLPNDFHVPLSMDEACVDTFNEITEAAKHFLKADLLADIRVYLTLAQHSQCEMSDSLHEPIQNEYVGLRREDPSITADDLHSLLILTRLICLSEGKQVTDLSSWERACYLEGERRKRIK